MKRKCIVIPLLLLCLLAPSILFAKKDSTDYLKKAKTTLPSQCLFYFKMYLNAKGPKAFAYAVDSKKKVTCRFSSSSVNQTRADEVALASCKKSSQKKGITSACKIYHIDSSISKTKKQLDFEQKYLINLNSIRKETSHPLKKKVTKKIIKPKVPTPKKVKSTITEDMDALPKQCKMFYQLYKEAKEHKSFAIAVDNDKKYVCKYSAGSKSRKRAQEVALASCDKTRKERGVKKPCQLFAAKEKKEKELQKKEPQTQKKLVPKIKKREVVKKVPSSPTLEKAILATNLHKIKNLIKKGADINVEASDKSRALFVAVAKGDIAFTKELLKKGAFVFIKKRNGNNLLVAAIMSGSNTMLRLMLEQGIDPNIRCEDGNTPLHFALMMFDDTMMKTLYKFSARDDIKNTDGKSVKDLAKEFRLNLKRIKR